MTSKFLLTTASILSLAVTSLPAQAGDTEHQIVEQVITAYGGDKFEKMKSLTLTSDLRYGWIGQGHTPDFVDLNPMRKIHEFDFVKGFGSEEAWGGAGGYAERVFTTDKGQFIMDYTNKTYVHDEEADLYAHFGGEMRGSDTLLAHELMKHRESAKFQGQKIFRGTPHNLLEFDMPGTPIDPVLWVNSETGHISKMRRDIPDYHPINYVFNDFKTAKGVSYAEVFELYIGSTLIEYTKSRELVPNRIRKNTFVLDAGISPAPETFDTDEMSINAVSESLHHVGQNGGFSSFVDAGDHIIAVGGYGGFGDRFKAYQEAQDQTKPLKYLIITHHHRDHLEGAPDALELGAQLIGPETARTNLDDVTEQELSSAQFRVLTDIETEIGPLMIHRISTGHVIDFALAYFPDAKTVFDADHISANFKTRVSSVGPNGMAMKTEIERLGLDVDHLVTAHSPKVESWQGILEAAKNHVPGLCPTGRKICADLG